MGIFNGTVHDGSPRDRIAEAILSVAQDYHMDEMGVEIHEVTDPSKVGAGRDWLSLYLQNDDHQTGVKVYGPRFIMFRVWRPFMGRKGTSQIRIYKSVESAETFMERSLVRGVWTRELSA